MKKIYLWKCQNCGLTFERIAKSEPRICPQCRDKGVKSVHGGRVGDLICKVVVETPVNLNREQKETLQSFAASLAKDGTKHTPRSGSWFEAVKKFFEKI